ncbi:NAD(P)-dependent oxidoreductase [Janibacter sp. G56]|uniref:NAD(P)-dependent oxidoreductase n=1 Tax=Janibacter sp. G56 TaxID=3418717 RepID=UPI003CFF9ACF
MTAVPAEWRSRLVAPGHPDRRILIIGGGPTAARRACQFVRDGLAVTIIADRICDSLVDLLVERAIEWENRPLGPEDLVDAWLVLPATGDPIADATVCRWVDRMRGRGLPLRGVGALRSSVSPRER